MTGRTGGRLRYYSLFLLYLFFFFGGEGREKEFALISTGRCSCVFGDFMAPSLLVSVTAKK